MNRSLRLSLLALAVLLGSAPVASAQLSCNTTGCSVSNTASVTVNAVVRLDISTAATSLTSPVDANFGDGVTPGTPTTDAGPTLSVKANRSWTLSVKAGAATFTPGTSGGYAKPASDLTVTTGTTTRTLSTGNQTIASGAATGTGSFPMTYNTSYLWASDVPDTYTLNILYTITAP